MSVVRSSSTCSEPGMIVPTRVECCGSIWISEKNAFVSALDALDRAAEVDVDAADPVLRRRFHRLLEFFRFAEAFTAFGAFDHFFEVGLGFAVGEVVADHADHRFVFRLDPVPVAFEFAFFGLFLALFGELFEEFFGFAGVRRFDREAAAGEFAVAVDFFEEEAGLFAQPRFDFFAEVDLFVVFGRQLFDFFGGEFADVVDPEDGRGEFVDLFAHLRFRGEVRFDVDEGARPGPGSPVRRRPRRSSSRRSRRRRAPRR